MALVMFAGGETGDVAEVTVTGTAAISAAQFYSGAYSYECHPLTTAVGWFTVVGGVSATLKYTHFRFRCAALPAAAEPILSDNGAGAAIELRLNSTGTVSIYTTTTLQATGTQVLQINTWYEFRVFFGLNNTSQTNTVEINGIPDSSYTATINGSAALFAYGKLTNRNGSTCDFFYDDIVEDGAALPPIGSKVIARQIAANGNYNSWTYSTGTLMSGVVDDTPTDATTNLSVGTSLAFTGTLDFTLTGGLGSTGHGTEIVSGLDTIFGFKIGAWGNTSNATTDGADSARFRTGGADTDTALAAWTTTAAPGLYRQVLKATAPTAAQVRSCEVGLLKTATGSRTHTVYSIWGMVLYVPTSFSLIFSGGQYDDSANAIPLSFESVTDDTGDDTWYDPFWDDSAILFGQRLTDAFILSYYSPLELEQLIEDTSEEQAWYPPQEEILGYLYKAQSSILIFNDYSPDELEQLTEDEPIGHIPSQYLILNSIGLDSLLEASQWDSMDPSVISPDDYIDDTGDDQGWYPAIEELLQQFISNVGDPIIISITNDYSPLEVEQLLDDVGDDQGWYPPQEDVITPSIFSQFLVSTYGLWDYSPLELEQLIEDTSEEQSWYPPQEDIITPTLFSQALLDFGLEDYSPLELEQLIEDTSEEQAWYPSLDELLSWFITISQSLNLVFDDYSPQELEQLIEDSEGDFYPDFGIDNSWYFGLVTSLDPSLITIDYSPLELEQLIDDLADEQAWYPPQEDIITPSIFSQFLIEVDDYSPLEAEQLIEDSEGDFYPPGDTDGSLVNVTLVTELFIVNEYAPDFEMFDESIGFQSSVSSYGIVFGINENFIFNDYSPSDTEQLIDDLGEDDYYHPLYDDIEAGYTAIPQFTFAQIDNSFIDYLELYIDDVGDDNSRTDVQEDIITPSIFSQQLINFGLALEDYSPLELEQLIEDTEGDYYPDFGNEIAWYFIQVIPLDASLFFNEYAPLETEQLDENTGFPASAPSYLIIFGINENLVFNDYSPLELEQLTEDSEGDYYPSFDTDPIVNFTIVTGLFVFNEYSPLEVEQLIEESEGDYYPSFDVDPLISFTVVTELFVFNEYIPLELEQLTEDIGETDFYPPIDADAALVNVTIVTGLFVFHDYNPLEIDQIIEDTSEEQAWYPSQEDIITPTLFSQSLMDFGLEDYSPLELEQLIEDSEGDFYPDFGIDPTAMMIAVPFEPFVVNTNDFSPLEIDQLIDDTGDDTWYDPFWDDSAILFGQRLTDAFILRDYSPIELEQLLEDTGDEQAWYPSQEDIITPTIFVQRLLDFGLEDYSPLELEQLIEDFGEEQAWYFPVDTDGALVNVTLQTQLFIVIDYSPLEVDQLIDDTGDDTWYDPFWDDSAILFGQRLTEAFVLRGDYSPEPWFDEDTSDEPAWYPPQDDPLSWYYTNIRQQQFLVFLDYSPLELEQLIEDFGEDDTWYGPFGDIAWVIPLLIPPLAIENLIGGFQFESTAVPDSYDDLFTEDTSDMDSWYGSFGTEPEPWFFLIGAGITSLVFNDYVPLESDTLIEESEGDYYPTIEELISWFIPTSQSLNLIFDDYSPQELEQLTEESEGDFYAPIDVDPLFTITIVIELFVFNEYIPLELEQLADDSGDEQAWYLPKEEELQWIIPSLLSAAFIFNEYIPLELEQLTDDSGDEQSWYPPIEELISWFIPISQSINLVFDDYSPSDTDQLIEDMGESDFYPETGIDIAWYFVPPSGVIFVFNEYTPLELEQLIEDDGSEPEWQHGLDYFAIVIPTHQEFFIIYLALDLKIQILYLPLTEPTSGGGEIVATSN